MALCGNATVSQHFENIASVLGNGKLAGVMNSIQTCLLGTAANTFLFETLFCLITVPFKAAHVSGVRLDFPYKYFR